MADAEHAGRRTPAEMAALGWFTDDRLVWSKSAWASSSYGGGWTPDAVVGPPTVFPKCGDQRGAWAPRTYGSSVVEAEWLDVEFPKGVRARAVWIFETNAPGAVFEVIDCTTPGSDVVLWSGDARKLDQTARVLIVPLAEPRPIAKLRVRVDASTAVSWPEIDAVALVRDEEGGDGAGDATAAPQASAGSEEAASGSAEIAAAPKKKKRRRGRRGKKVDWRKPPLTRGAKIRLAAVFAIASTIVWSCVAPRGLVVSEVTPARVESAKRLEDLASDVRWAKTVIASDAGSASSVTVGAPDGTAWMPSKSGDRIALEVVGFDESVEARGIVLVETRPFAVVRIDDVSWKLRPVTVWRGATTEIRHGDDGVVRIDFAEPRSISRLRLVVDRTIARGGIDAIGLVPR